MWSNANGQTVYGPVMAGGDHTTLNTAAYNIAGSSFDATLIPAMRMIVDFGQIEPMMGQNSTGQSSNPASPHYTDGARGSALMHQLPDAAAETSTKPTARPA